MKKTKSTEAYQAWLDSKSINRDKTEIKTLQNKDFSEDVLRAEPDLVAVPEIQVPDELQAAIEVIQEGGLQKLSPTQQKIFQLSVVEGVREREIMTKLGLDAAAVRYHLRQIGFILRKRCEKKLKDL